MTGLPMAVAQAWVDRGLDWLAMTEDLPHPENRVVLTAVGADPAGLHARTTPACTRSWSARR